MMRSPSLPHRFDDVHPKRWLAWVVLTIVLHVLVLHWARRQIPAPHMLGNPVVNAIILPPPTPGSAAYLPTTIKVNNGDCMNNPNASGIPGMGAMTDTIDFMKNLWGGMSMPGLPGMKIPGMVMPTLSVEEINKQIKDLKAVESWLTMNLNMLRGTIQALEVQSATISTIQSVSESFTAAMKTAAEPEVKAKPERPKKPIFESPFAQPAAPDEMLDEEAFDEELDDMPPDNAAQTAPPAKEKVAADPSAPPMANPAAWWGMLQDQFKQAVDAAAAMTPEKPKAPAAKTASDDTAAQPAKAKESKAAKAGKAAPAKKAAKAPARRKAAPKD